MEDGGEQERELADKYRAWSRRLSFEYPYVSGVLGRIADDYERARTRGSMARLRGGRKEAAIRLTTTGIDRHAPDRSTKAVST